MLPRERTAPLSDVELEELARDGAIALRGALDRPGTFLESPQMRAGLPDLGLKDGDPFRGDLYPQVWPPPD
jgi:hypothetical protein